MSYHQYLLTVVSLSNIVESGYHPMVNLGQAFPTRHLYTRRVTPPCLPQVGELRCNLLCKHTFPGANPDFA